MCKTRKADFYYGAMLSKLVNTGFAPAILEPGENRRIYSMTTNNGDYEIYSKYVSKPSSHSKGSKLWQFNFSEEEVSNISEYSNNNSNSNKELYFILICGQKNLHKSQLALLKLNQAIKCLGIDYKGNIKRISVKYEKGIHGLNVYGTGRDYNDSIRITKELDIS